MATVNETILVSGATGKQGGAVVRHLMSDGWQVKAMTRDPDKAAARDLAERGAEVVRADFDDRESLDAALEGAYGVFSVQNPWEQGPEHEDVQGRRFADAALDAGVQHFVYSSVGSSYANTGIPHFDSKWRVEEYLDEIGLHTTVVRPVFFMDNFFAPDFRQSLRDGTLAMGLEPDTTLQLIAVDDIGAFVAMAFDRPEEFGGEALDLAGDELRGPDMASIFADVMGRPVEYVHVPADRLREVAGEEMAVMFEWFNEVGYEADIARCRELNPALATLEQWAKETGWGDAA